ncbi:hypothetical protein L1D54_07170 [Vibrio brasiliensis]|uniref:hypothetical protein n=1 Tax=Vibrio brasiliensis TaxID=170652 RepID=UPI001EFC67BF|nr:hypothetical protein [Vibrio brasiliensis]MCG9750256.1 hypothetical protein [Vibrio brasiliensis]
MKFKYFYCVYVLAALYVMTSLLTLAGFDMYVDVTSLITVLVPSVIVGIGSYVYAEDKFFSSVVVTALVSGFFGTTAGIIATFSNVFDAQGVYAGLAVSLLPLLYSLSIILFLVPMSFRK